MKTTSHKEVCSEAGLEFVQIVHNEVKLENNEYYALMVLESQYPDSPHIKGVDFFTHQYLVGIECPSNDNGCCYLSKKFSSRKNGYRGNTIVVKVNDISKHYIL